eukprot:gene16497-7915_t
MANPVDKLHLRESAFQTSSSNEPLLFGSVGSGQSNAQVLQDRGDMYTEAKVANGPEGSRPKKSLFEITNVENTDNRGDSVGNEIEDLELDETLSEIHEVSSPTELTDTSRLSLTPEESVGDIGERIPAANANGSEATQIQSSSVSQTSRFKIVKVARAEPYKRGRWACQEFMSESKLDRNVSEPRISLGGNNSINPQVSESREHFSQSLVFSKQENIKQGTDQYVPVELSQNGSHNKVSKNPNPESVLDNREELSGLATGPGAVLAELETRADTLREFAQSNQKRGASATAPLSIQEALTQITTIQSTLESVVETLKDVETLKETVSTWTDENQRLKEENERLKRLLQQDKDSETKDSS